MEPRSGGELFADGFWDRPLDEVDSLRAQSKVYRSTLTSGVRVWVITGYADAKRALTDPRLRKDARTIHAIIDGQQTRLGDMAQVAGILDTHMLFVDGLDHARLRRIVGLEFTRARVEALRPRIEVLAASMLDALPVDEPVDLVSSLACPLMLAVICDLLGIPSGDRELLSEWTTALMEEDVPRTVRATWALSSYLNTLIDHKRSEPGDDLLSVLIHPRDAGDCLSTEELLGTVFLLLTGFQASANLITTAVFRLLSHQGSWNRLRESPWLLPTAVEEILRFDTPMRMTTHRYTTEPVEYGGQPIPAGEIVLVWLHAANRDPDLVRCPDAATLNLERSPNSHLSFGHGAHYCFGAPLSRVAATVALGSMTRRYPKVRLLDVVARHAPSATMNGLLALPLVLGPVDLGQPRHGDLRRHTIEHTD
ncbi:putative cytochrome P450 hydroxylase [Alloactinosynnema sp. L-07]|uniref:cytochrome P450 family protein n=1 Tax=Alloactinosynnema sp. L-07 TaxID=1653480 RepID=UPI00065EFC0D|nr:cytochrome P450 [Alloactinosynnema sp. L-07]CRK59209.1 putative cytochrome P450 hydroxylase [Alloactinosynnema sp. L-07]